MKQNLKNWFKKKNKQELSEETTSPQETYTAMNSNSLYNLPPSELVSIIFKFDQEVKNLNKELSSAKEYTLSMKTEYPKSQEQLALYKHHNETLQSECNKLATDLNEAVASLESNTSQVDVLKTQLASRDEVIRSFDLQIRDLEKQVLDLQFNGIPFEAGDEIVKLKNQVEEAHKSNAEIGELKIMNKVLEGEVSKLVASVTEGKEQIRMWKDKAGLFENARKELEVQIHKKNSETEALANEISKLQFLKESSDTEIRALKESLSHKDMKLKKKLVKIETLQEQNIDFQQRTSVMKYELDFLKQKSQDDQKALQVKCEQDKQEIENIYSEKNKALEIEIQVLNKRKEEFLSLEAEMAALLRTNKGQQDSLTNLLTEIHQKTIKITALESEITRLSDQLKKSNQKRELARNEILKLSQRLGCSLPSKPAISQIEATIKAPMSRQEIDLLDFLKIEIDTMYKNLMKIISGCDGTFYQIKIEDFSFFEKRINNMAMQLHEQLEEISDEKIVNRREIATTSKPSKGRAPIKLFSCMADQDDAPRLIPKPKRSIQEQSDNRLVLRRGSAN